MEKSGHDFKQDLKDILHYYEYKLDSGNCQMSEMKSLSHILMENMEINGTIDDFAQFYKKSKDAVNSVIKRRMITKPKRNVVLYPFHVFQKLIPNSWRVKNK